MTRHAHCPICVILTKFEADSDRELFAQVANHTVNIHGGDPVDAFNTALVAVPGTGAWYVRDARLHPENYQ
jgi:hypothetical protein